MIFLRSLMLILSLVTFTAFAQTVGSTGSSSSTVTCEPGSCGGECPCECDDCDCECGHEACQCDCEDCGCENCDCDDCCNCGDCGEECQHDGKK